MPVSSFGLLSDVYGQILNQTLSGHYFGNIFLFQIHLCPLLYLYLSTFTLCSYRSEVSDDSGESHETLWKEAK